MKEKLVPFILGAVLSSAGVVGFQAAAASGDVVYEVGTDQQCITAAQAACYADCAIADGTWTGSRTNVIRVKAFRLENCEGTGKNFAATVRGKVSAPLASVPDGSVLRGVVP